MSSSWIDVQAPSNGNIIFASSETQSYLNSHEKCRLLGVPKIRQLNVFAQFEQGRRLLFFLVA